ncbi:MAG TPA: twin-arginine translocase TatA/TatE family subunit [Candidatus Acidoferrales bacterium]|nr:twin-arginine translocase TatA/TatE family subunit [Candidatus Acidoferrales bacterium]
MDLFEIILILAVALIVLGPERLPEVMRVTGKVLRELRLASNTMLRELTDALDEQPANVAAPATAAANKPAAPDKPPEQT